jgi:hypothetical protein
MTPELDVVLRLVAEGRLTADEAAPVVAALEEQARRDRGGEAATASGFETPGRDGARRLGSAQDALTGRRLRVYVAEQGRQVINIRSGMKGPIVEVSDEGDEVLIAIE